MKTLYYVAIALAGIITLLTKYFGKKAKERRKAEQNYEKLEKKIDDGSSAADVQSIYDDMANGL